MKNRPNPGDTDSAPSGPGFFTGNAELDRQNVDILLRVIATVNSAANFRETLNSIVDGAIQLTRTERGLLFLYDEFNKLRVRVARDQAGRDLPQDIRFSRGIPRRATEERKPIYSVVTSDEEAFELGTSVMELKLRAVMCVPLMIKDQIIGAVYVDSKAGSREFTELDLNLFESLAHQATVTVEKMRSQEMESSLKIAQDIQRYLLAPSEVDLPGFDIHALSRPCAETNGDYLDFVSIGADRLGIAVGDVTGHGIGPALLVARTQAFLEAYVEQDQDPGSLLFRINNVLESHTRDDNFVTLFFSEIDAANRRLSYSSAGHPPALLFRAESADFEELPKTGVPLGIQRDFPYRKKEGIRLADRDVLLIYTDGLTEAMDPERDPFGMDRLKGVIREAWGQTAREISDFMLEKVREHTAGTRLLDDLTWVIVRVGSA